MPIYIGVNYFGYFFLIFAPGLDGPLDGPPQYFYDFLVQLFSLAEQGLHFIFNSI